MIANCVILLTMNLLVICAAFSKSPLMQFSVKSFDAVAAMKQAAVVLNVPVPGNWADYMGPTTSSGSHGQATVGMSTINSVMANWTIPEQFRDDAIKNVRLLVLGATEGTYSAQTFSFDTVSGTSLTTLLVVATRMFLPVDSDSPVAVMYVTINTNASIKQLYSHWTERVCKKCKNCLWISDCCCKNEARSSPRGHTIEESSFVLQKMKSDQFIWFNQQNLSASASKTLEKWTNSNDNTDDQNISLNEAIENFLSNENMNDEILASYNDSVITAIQTNMTSLKLSSQTMKMNRVQRKNLPAILTSLAEDHGFDNIYSNSNYSQQLESARFSYENLYTLETDTKQNSLLIKYVWILGQLIDNSTYTLHFLSVNITSRSLIETMLLNGTTKFVPSRTMIKNKRLNIVRISTLAANGDFLNERLLTSITAWQQKTTRTVLNILRFIGATVLVPKKFRMLSHFDAEVIAPETSRNNLGEVRSNGITNKIAALASSISTVIGTGKDIIQILKSSKSVTIQQIIRFGFSYFNQKSTVLKVIDIPSNKVNKFVKAVIMDYDLPSKGSLMLGLTYSEDLAWEQIQYLYSPAMNGSYRSLTIFKNGDSIKNTASFFIADIDANWNLAPDLLIITKSTSKWGGLYSSSSQSIQEVPHVLTFDEAIKLQQFFMLVAIGNIGSTLGLNITIPELN